MEGDHSDISEIIQNVETVVQDAETYVEEIELEYQEEENEVNKIDSKSVDQENVFEMDSQMTISEDELDENEETVNFEDRFFKRDYQKSIDSSRQNWGLEDEDLISIEGSYARLTWMGIILTTILFFVSGSQIVRLFIIFWPEKPPLIVQPILPESKFLRKFPTPHLVTVSKNGEIYDFSLAENVSPSRGYLMTLKMQTNYENRPNELPRHYYVFSDPKGFLYFVDSELKTHLISYHQIEHHKVIPNSVVYLSQSAKKTHHLQSLLINGFFWLFGQVGFLQPANYFVYPFSGSMTLLIIMS